MQRLFEDVWTYIVFTLVLIGIVGISLILFKDDGLVELALGVVWDAEVRNPLLITPILGGTLFLLSVFLRDGLGTGKGPWLSDLLLYSMMACGIFFSYQWWNT